MDNKVIFPELSYKIWVYASIFIINWGDIEMRNSMGFFLENILKENKLDFVREKPLLQSFEGEVNRRNIPDFIIEDKIILDFKAKLIITKEDYFQMKRYLVSYGKKLGLIMNF